MAAGSYQYIYGPVQSWRLGVSLGVDPLSRPEKLCNFNCRYCQLGPTVHFHCQRDIYVPTDDIISEIRGLPEGLKLDTITLSGRGEPTLARNLGEIIRAVQTVRPEPVAVITNAVLMDRPDVRDDLGPADLVLVKMDAFDQASLQRMNAPPPDVRFDSIVLGIKEFRKQYPRRFALQIMFTGDNKSHAAQIAGIVRGIGADEIELNTPLRPNPSAPLSRETLDDIKVIFSGCAPEVKTVYELQSGAVRPLNKDDTVKRHGSYSLDEGS